MASLHPIDFSPLRRIAARFLCCRLYMALLLMLISASANACWQEVANFYGINVQLLYAIAKTESGINPKAINHNKNGSDDIGMMQINSSWLPMLKKYGIDRNRLLDPCTNLQVAAWILSKNMQKMGVTWEAVGAYNAKSPDLRIKYAKRVYSNLFATSHNWHYENKVEAVEAER